MTHHSNPLVLRLDKRVLAIRTIGNFLVLSALIAILFTFWPVIYAFGNHWTDNLLGKKYEAAPTANTSQSFGSLLGRDDPNLKVLAPKDPNFSIIVEKIGANAPIIANVDASNKPVYLDALKRGVGHALGTSFPGEIGGNLFICSLNRHYF